MGLEADVAQTRTSARLIACSALPQ
jgi:hypothetical protein